MFRTVPFVSHDLATPLTEFLQTWEAPEVIQRLTGIVAKISHPTVSEVEAVRNLLPVELRKWSGVLVDVAIGTYRAQTLGKWQPGFLFTKTGSEQGSHPLFAAFRTEVFQGTRHILEVGTGCGVDTATLAAHASEVVSYEPDLITAAIAQGNLRRAGVHNATIVNKGWMPSETVKTVQGIWADPSRRLKGGRRTRDVEQYSPPLSSIHRAVHETKAIAGIRLGPTDGDSVLPSASHVRVHAIHRDCHERVLVKSDHVPDGVSIGIGHVGRHQLSFTQHVSAEELALSRSHRTHTTSRPKTGLFLIEPHPVVIAAGMVDWLFHTNLMSPIDPQIAYGLSNSPIVHDHLFDTYEILEVQDGVRVNWMNERLRALNWTRSLVIKKRGWSGETEVLRRKLDLSETGDHDPSNALIISRIGNKHITMLCRAVRRESL